MTKIVVIGGSGYIGVNLIKELKKRGDDVVSYDNKNSGQEALMYEWLFNFLKTEKPDIVYHLANLPGHLDSINRPREYIHNNFISTLNVAECARFLKFKIVFASSAGVYGNQPVPWYENSSIRLKIDSPYSFAKIISEDLLKNYYKQYGVKSVSCRISSPYGGINEGSHQPEAIIPKFIREAKEGKKIIIYGENRTRDFTHIDDLVDGLIRASKSSNPFVLNISSGNEYKFVDVVKKLTDNYEIKPLKELGEDIPERWFCSINMLTCYGFEPKHDLMEYLDNILKLK